MPRLNCTFAEFRDIIEANGFTLHPNQNKRKGSHIRYRAKIDGVVRYVDIDPKPSWKSNIGPELLNNMIRQSGLSKKLFRK